MKITDVDEPIIAVRRSQYPTDNKQEFLLLVEAMLVNPALLILS